MPRVTAVKAEIGTTGEIVFFLITGMRHIDIAEAVDREHHCEDSHCDICEANENGFPYSAAYLLSGATETPLLDAVCAAYGFNPSATYDKIPDWREWLEYFMSNGVECPSCGAFNFDSDTCGNCLALLSDIEQGGN